MVEEDLIEIINTTDTVLLRETPELVFVSRNFVYCQQHTSQRDLLLRDLLLREADATGVNLHLVTSLRMLSSSLRPL